MGPGQLCSCKCNASVNSKHQHPPPRADLRGIFLQWSKTLPRGKIFLQKHGPRDKKIPTPGSIVEDLVSFSCWLGRNFGILQKSNLKKNWKAVQVISFSFSLSTILKVLKFSPSFQTDFVTREQQRDGTSV